MFIILKFFMKSGDLQIVLKLEIWIGDCSIIVIKKHFKVFATEI
jgi:hypothetical protein